MNEPTKEDQKVRNALLTGCRHTITSAVVERAYVQKLVADGPTGGNFKACAMVQLSRILNISLIVARALVSEHTYDSTTLEA